MIEFASKNDFKEITELWKDSFGDSDLYINHFLNTLFTNDNCLIYREGSSIVSMLFLLKTKIISKSLTHPAYYIYAACTAPDNRGKGIMAKLLLHAIDYSALQGIDFLCLVPGNEHLFEYYSRFGFKSIFKRKEFTLSSNIINQLSENGAEICTPSIEAVKSLRDSALSTGNCLLWEENVIKYAIEENELSGGQSVFAQKGGKFIGYAVYQIERDTVIIKELCALNHSFGLLAKIIAEQTKGAYFQFSLPLEFPLSVENSTVRDNGMILSLNAIGTTALETMFQAFVGLTLE